MRFESIWEHSPCLCWTNLSYGAQNQKSQVRKTNQIISSLDILLQSQTCQEDLPCPLPPTHQGRVCNRHGMLEELRCSVVAIKTCFIDKLRDSLTRLIY